MGGSAGPGKTDCLLMEATRHVEHPRYNGLVLRRTFPQLREIIDRCHEYYPEFGAIYRATEHRWHFPSGATIQIGHMQHESDRYNYQGAEYQGIFWDELTQFTEDQYLYLHSRCRAAYEDLPTRIRATCNPGGVGHVWVKRRFVDVCEPGETYVDPDTGLSRCFVPARVWDNPTLMEIDPGYIARLEALPETERKRLLHGDWTVFDGQFFPELDARNHSCEPFEIPPEWPRTCVLDWGFAKPFAVLWGALDYDGVLWVYREWYGCKLGQHDVGLRMVASDVADQILEIEKDEKIKIRIADPSIWNRLPKFRQGEVYSDTIYTDMAARQVVFLKAHNDRVQGWQQVQRRLQMDEGKNQEGEIVETPRVQIFSNLTHFWRTMTQLQADKNNPEDCNTTMEDHLPDAFRYMCAYHQIQPKKVQQIPTGSFAAERKRMIRAKRYARSHGVSLESAYSRVR